MPLASCNPISEVTSHRFCHILFARSVCLGPAPIQGEGITHREEYQELGITGDRHTGKPQIQHSSAYLRKYSEWQDTEPGRKIHDLSLLYPCLGQFYFPSLGKTRLNDLQVPGLTGEKHSRGSFHLFLQGDIDDNS